MPDHLLSLTGGERETELPAVSFRELVQALERRWPGVGEALGKCMVAIDGQIIHDPFLDPLEPDSEVFIMQRIEGG